MLCDLSFFHFYYVPEQKQNFLVSDLKLSEWKIRILENKKTNNPSIAAYLKCGSCKYTIARKMEHRGTWKTIIIIMNICHLT